MAPRPGTGRARRASPILPRLSTRAACDQKRGRAQGADPEPEGRDGRLPGDGPREARRDPGAPRRRRRRQFLTAGDPATPGVGRVGRAVFGGSGRRRRHRPQGRRVDVLDEDPVAGDGRLGPCRAVGGDMAGDRLEAGATGPRHDQLGVVVEQERESFRLDDGGVLGPTRRPQPQRRPGVRIEGGGVAPDACYIGI